MFLWPIPNTANLNMLQASLNKISTVYLWR